MKLLSSCLNVLGYILTESYYVPVFCLFLWFFWAGQSDLPIIRLLICSKISFHCNVVIKLLYWFILLI